MATKKIKEEDQFSATAISKKLEGLFELQSVDSQIDKLQILRGELPLEVTDLESEIDKLNEHLKSQSDIDEQLNNSISSQEQKIEEANALIEKYNKQQMKVRNNREFDAINKELEFQGLEIELSNKKIKGVGSELEENAEKIKLIKAKIRTKKKHLKNKKSELDVIIKSTEKEEDKLTSKKKKLQKNIEDRLMSVYDNLRTVSKNGLAVVKVERNACGGCFSSITSQHHLNIKLRKDILFCENCGRILVPDDIDQK
ncbi:MAG: hypothetical protein CMP49_05985 [Flavobacteriales bacterium]|nr:hypothetical protein [Flavobacteriales bacterium]